MTTFLKALLLLASLLLVDAAVAVAATGVAVAGAGVAVAGAGVAAAGTGVAAAGLGVDGATGCTSASSTMSGNRGAWKPPPAVHTAPDEKPLLFCDAQARLEPEGPLKHLKPPVLDV
jgi:hypothetical protein